MPTVFFDTVGYKFKETGSTQKTTTAITGQTVGFITSLLVTKKQPPTSWKIEQNNMCAVLVTVYRQTVYGGYGYFWVENWKPGYNKQ